MEKYTEEMIKKEMEGINETDLQNRLKKLYEEREKINNKKLDNNNSNEVIAQKLRTLEENIDLSIKVYEANLPVRFVERARRSAGMYNTQEDYSDSIKKEENDAKER